MTTVSSPRERVHRDQAVANDLLDAALAYAEQGLSVVPLHHVTTSGRCSCDNKECKSIAKHPCVMRWGRYRDRAATAKQIQQWWRKWPDANVGIVTGRISGLAVVDIDGDEGWRALAEADIDLKSVRTPTVRTGRGGHVYLQYPDGSDLPSRAGVLEKVDIRADNGMVVAPPSVHARGSVYTWEDELSLDDLEPAAFDLEWAVKKDTPQRAFTGGGGGDWLLGAGDIDPRVRTAANLTLTEIAEAPEGTRHDATLAATALLAGLVTKGLADEDVLLPKALAAWHASGQTDDGELERMWFGARRKNFGDKQAVLSQAKKISPHAVAQRLRNAGYRWLDAPYNWQRYEDGRWGGRTPSAIATAVHGIYEQMGDKPSAYQIDEAVKIARSGPCATLPRALEAELDGSAFRLSDNEPVPGVLYDDVRVEVLPDGGLKTHPHSEDVFTPQSPLRLSWGDGAVAPTPRWDALCKQFQLLGRSGSLDPEMLLRYVGAALAGDADHHKFFALFGAAGAGKTALINVLRGLLEPNATFDPRDQWALAGIERARLVTSDDVTVTDNGAMPWGWERVKSLTGQSAFHVQIKHRPSYTARFRGLYVMASNAKPEFSMHKDKAAWARRALFLRATPFDGKRIDGFHDVILKEEGEAVVRRALHVYAEQVVKAGGWGHLEEHRAAARRAAREPVHLRNTKAEIRNVLRVHPGLPFSEIYERIPRERRASKATVRKKLSELYGAGKVGRDEDGGYRLPSTGTG